MNILLSIALVCFSILSILCIWVSEYFPTKGETVLEMLIKIIDWPVHTLAYLSVCKIIFLFYQRSSEKYFYTISFITFLAIMLFTTSPKIAIIALHGFILFPLFFVLKQLFRQ